MKKEMTSAASNHAEWGQVKPSRSSEYVVFVPLACNAESERDPDIVFEGEAAC